ncbi:hypothetical protein DCS_00147 [Drechmeria coniospora]|uniref:Uncharacterized protein n=1 Tax=Drechmeria coniospora TaxID=98403 RepID=A0A151GPK8_DRECN|nr:hypothetical protein DCS_00147 [Drechmeria coniospora]KYK59020.1 hypothetical protein DCS_00147 [Drechmeria coniospora]
MPEGSPIPEHLFVHRTDTPIGHTHHGCKLELGNPHLISQANLSTLITISTTFNSLMFRDGCKAPAHEWVEYDRILDRFKDFGYDFHPHALPKCVMKSASDDSVGKERWHPNYVDKILKRVCYEFDLVEEAHMEILLPKLNLDPNYCREYAEFVVSLSRVSSTAAGWTVDPSNYDISDYPKTSDFNATCNGLLWNADMIKNSTN